MARPQGADSERTKHQILCAAIRHFGAYGLKGATMKSIASDCGITFATIHHYFGGKKDLFHATLDASYDELHGFREALMASFGGAEGELRTKLRVAAKTALSFSREHRDASRFLLRAALYEEEARERTRASQRAYLDLVSAALAPLIGQPADALRIPLQGLIFLITRVAVMDEDDLQLVLNGNDDSDALANYIADVAVHTLLGSTALAARRPRAGGAA